MSKLKEFLVRKDIVISPQRYQMCIRDSLKCFGHTWIGLDNRTGHTVYLKDRAIPDGEMVTFSAVSYTHLGDFGRLPRRRVPPAEKEDEHGVSAHHAHPAPPHQHLQRQVWQKVARF